MAKHDDIIQATIEVIAEKGIADAPTILLSKRAGVAEYTVFRHFGSKENLLNECYADVVKKFRAASADAIDSDLPYDERLREVYWAFVRHYRKFPAELAFLLQFFSTPSGEKRRPEYKHAAGEDISSFPFVNLIHKGVQAGVFVDLPLSVLAALSVYPVFTILREEQVTGKNRSEEELKRIIDLCIQVVKT